MTLYLLGCAYMAGRVLAATTGDPARPHAAEDLVRYAEETRCPTCNGRGVIRAETEPLPGFRSSGPHLICPTCGGTGRSIAPHEARR
jgi:DnaJ-class molecular chaperone